MRFSIFLEIFFNQFLNEAQCLMFDRRSDKHVLGGTTSSPTTRAELGQEGRQQPAHGSLRILYLTAESYPTFRPDVSVLFGRYLPLEGVVCDVVAPRAQATSEASGWAGTAITRRIEGGGLRRRLLSVWHGLASAWRADVGLYQALQVRDMPVVAALVLPIARCKRLPFFYWMSYPIPEGQIQLARDRGLRLGWMKFLYPWVSGRVGRFLLKRWVLRHADHVFVQSPRMKDELVAAGAAASRMTPVLMGVDLASMNADLAARPLDARLVGRRVIGYLGTLERPRQIERLFEMLALVRREVPEAVLLIVGDDEDLFHRQWLRDQADLAGVTDAVIWAGWMPTRAAWQLISSSEVALSPIPRGPLLDPASPTKVPEYLALGIPVVCNDNPDQASVIRESGAGICVPYSAGEFAAAVLMLLAQGPSNRSAMIEAGKRYVAEKRDYRVLAKQLAEVYRHLLQPIEGVG